MTQDALNEAATRMVRHIRVHEALAEIARSCPPSPVTITFRPDIYPPPAHGEAA